MTVEILPPHFDDLLCAAIQVFWTSRASNSPLQKGNRGNVISGNNLNGFLEVIKAVSAHCGLPESAIFTNGRASLTLPGYYRPNKSWDVIIIHERRLLAVFEFKSQVGSFGNNFNNRAEEAIGSASDLWEAFQAGYYLPQNYQSELENIPFHTDPRSPFMGYLMLLQKCEASTRSVSLHSPHYHVYVLILKEHLMQKGIGFCVKG